MNGPIRKSRPDTAQKLAEARWSRRYFLRLSGLTGVGVALGAPFLGTVRAQGTASLPASTPQPISSGNSMNRDDLVQGLIRIGEQAIVREDDAALDAYFAQDFAFHGPLGDLDLHALKSFWASQRAAFSDLTITRGRIIVEGNFVAAQTTFSGVFEREFTQSPVGPLPPTGRRFTQNLINLFQYDEEGRLAEEWVQYDNRELLRELGAEGR